MILCVIYRQPTNTSHKSDAPEFIDMISSITSKIEAIDGPTPDIHICGDFNIPHTPINETSYTPTTSCNKQLLNILNDFMMHFNLNQIVHIATHKDGNILDFLLTNTPDMIFDYQSTPTVHSDHFTIEVSTHMTFKNKNFKNFKPEKTFHNKFDNYNFHSENVNWENIKKDLQCIDWEETLNSISDPDEQYKTFLNECVAVIISNQVPQRKPNKPKRIIPRDRRILMRKRTKLKKRRQTKRITQALINIELKLQKSYIDERKGEKQRPPQKLKPIQNIFTPMPNNFQNTNQKLDH